MTINKLCGLYLYTTDLQTRGIAEGMKCCNNAERHLYIKHTLTVMLRLKLIREHDDALSNIHLWKLATHSALQ